MNPSRCLYFDKVFSHLYYFSTEVSFYAFLILEHAYIKNYFMNYKNTKILHAKEETKPNGYFYKWLKYNTKLLH